MKKLLALVLAVLMVVSLFAACGKGDDTTGTQGADPTGSQPTGSQPTGSDPTDPTDPTGPAIEIKEGEFTYKTYTTALGTCWNPHAWETNGDSGILSYLETPLVSMSIDDSEMGVYQWIYLAATEVNDVTATHKEDLTKYGVTLPAGQTVEQTEKGFVFEIKLNPNMKWENGDPINADTYVYSMQALLDPEMMNYRANLFYAGESAVAGGSKYYFANTEGLYNAYTSEYATLADAVAAETVYIDVWGFWGAEGYLDAEGNECPQWVPYNDETIYSVGGDGETDAFSGALLYKHYGPYLEVGGGYEAYAAIYRVNEDMGATYDVVGFYKVDDYTVIYVTQSQIDYYYFMTSLTSNWLVHKETYEAGFDTSGKLKTTNYGTTKETTMSYGPYKIESLQDKKQLIFCRNENWYDYETTESGYIYSITDYLVDGEKRQQYQTTRIVIDVMDDNAAKQEFLKGNLSVWGPSANDLPTYSLSEQMYKADETYTMSFFFNTGIEALQAMDQNGNQNSIVLSNINFRKAFSLAIDRSEWVGSTAGYKPAYSLLNSLYFYDVYNDPNSSYRNSDPAMQAICNLYGVEWGEGTIYPTLLDAYRSINGYNLTEAKNLMKTACEELVAAGLYTAGEPIHIRIAYAKGALDASSNQQITLMQKYINAAIEGSGFGAITFEGVGNIDNRYAAVPAGEYAIGYGAWGGAAFYPFRNLQVYCDPDQYDINEAGCWDPKTETFTMTVNGVEMTKTWQEWSGCMVGSGDLANESNETKLQILATLEEAYLNFVYRIPLASSTSCTMLSFQCNYYTEDYNIMYGFGGFDLMTYNFNDAEWAEVIAEYDGVLPY